MRGNTSGWVSFDNERGFKRARERVDEVTSLFIDNLPKDVR